MDRVRWFSNPEVRQYLGNPVRHGTSMEEQNKWFEKEESSSDRAMFTILVNDKVVGNVGLSEIDETDKNAGIFVVIGDKNYWRQGIATEAVKFIIDHGFNKLKLHKLWLHVYEPNTAAIKLYEKLGFSSEGCLKEMALIDGKFVNEITMGMINPKDL